MRPWPPIAAGSTLRQAGALLALAGALLWPPAGVSATVLDPRTVHMAELRNGFRVIVCEDPSANVVAVELVVRAGSAQEGLDESGLAHLVEHACWSGAQGEDPRLLIEAVGGTVNAGTLRDYTRFYATVPAGELSLAVRALGAMVVREGFDERTIARERAVILREAALRADQPRTLLSDLAFEVLYGLEHPYGRPVEGRPESIATLSRGQAERFHRTWYVPNNMALIVSGRTGLRQALEEAEAVFGALAPASIPPRSAPAPVRPSPGLQRQARIATSEAYLMAAFVGPEASERTAVCASDLLATILCHSYAGRLVKELRDRRELASAVGVDFLTQRDRALFGLWAVCPPDRVPEVQKAIRVELLRIASEGVTERELALAKRLLAAGYAFANETPADRASTLGFYEAIDTYRAATQYLPRVRSIGADELRRLAAWYANDPVWIVLTPEEAPR